jgi:nitroreductase
MELFDVLKKRHMSRSFSLEPLAPAIISKLVYAGTRAPTGANLDYRLFIVVDDLDIIKMLKSLSPGFPGPPPLIIVILTNVTRATSEGGDLGRNHSSIFDSGAAAENIALAAIDLGLAVCFVKSYPEAAVRKILDIPEGFRSEIIVALGYPGNNSKKAVPKRMEPIYYNKFGVLGSQFVERAKV